MSELEICKYCGKPIMRGEVWNPDENGNGYHHACLINIEFNENKKHVERLAQKSILDKIRTEIKEWYWQADKQAMAKDPCVVDAMIDLFIRTIEKNEKEYAEPQKGKDK